MEKICFFAGHSKLYGSDDIYSRLVEAVENVIVNYNVKSFFVGNYGEFDRLSAAAVRELKKRYPDIRLILVIPYLTREIEDNKEFFYRNYDEMLIADIPEKTPYGIRIIKCNQYMANKSSHLICYVKNYWGGAAKTLEYARNKKDMNIINLVSTIN